MDLEEFWRLKSGKRTHSSSAPIELGKLATAFRAGIEVSSHGRHLDRDQLSIEIG